MLNQNQSFQLPRSKNAELCGVKNIMQLKNVTPKVSGKNKESNHAASISEISKSRGKKTAKGTSKIGSETSKECVPTTRKTKTGSHKEPVVTILENRHPVVFQNSRLSSSKEKLAELTLLDDTLVSLSVLMDSLQRKRSAESDIHDPENIKNIIEISREIRTLTALKFEVAKDIANMELKKIRAAMAIESHMRDLNRR